MNGALVFRIQPGNKEIEIAHPSLLAQRSVKLRDAIQGARGRRTVQLTTHESTTSAHSLEYVLEHLQYEFADAGGDECRAQDLAEVCNALMEYQCDPTPFQGLWDKVRPRSSLEPPLGQDPRSSSRSLEGSRTSSNDGAPGVRCWGTRPPRHAKTTAGQLAIAALVLGQQDALQRELGITVWALDVELDTCISELADLNAMRSKEKKAIFQVLKDQLIKLYLDEDSAKRELARKIRDRLNAEDLGEIKDRWEDNCRAHPNLTCWTPYELIRKYEKAIRLLDPRPPTNISHSKAPCYEFEDPRGPPLEGLSRSIGKGFNKIFKRNSASDNTAATIDDIFNEIEAQVKENQKSRAEGLISARTHMVTEWRRTLEGHRQRLTNGEQSAGHQLNGYI